MKLIGITGNRVVQILTTSATSSQPWWLHHLVFPTKFHRATGRMIIHVPVYQNVAASADAVHGGGGSTFNFYSHEIIFTQFFSGHSLTSSALVSPAYYYAQNRKEDKVVGGMGHVTPRTRSRSRHDWLVPAAGRPVSKQLQSGEAYITEKHSALY